jgi:hypothetical protein
VKLPIIFASAVLLFALNNPVNAAVLYSNLDASDGFDTTSAWGYTYSNAMQFSPVASGAITSADLALSVFPSFVPYTATISLYSSSNIGSAPDVLLESTTANVTNPFGSGTVTSALFSGLTSLISGQYYWLKAADANGEQLWNFNNTGVMGYFSQNDQSLSNYTLGAFRVNGTTTVPEPPSFALLALGLCLMAAAKRRT